MEKVKPIIIQGAMEMEVEELLRLVEVEKEEIINGYKFYETKVDGYPVVISETQLGSLNASIATCIAIEKYHPIAIVNQGTAGAHVDYVHRNDIIVGEKSVNINCFITGIKNENEGSNPLEWKFDTRSIEVNASMDLISIAKKMKNTECNVFFGILGSGDIFDREIDRIKWIHERKNTLCEENESISVYTVCDRMNVKCISFRVISNNEITQTKEDGATSTREDKYKNSNRMIYKVHDEVPANLVQRFSLEYVKELIKNINND